MRLDFDLQLSLDTLLNCYAKSERKVLFKPINIFYRDKFTSANEGDKRINEFEPENFELLKIPIVNYLFYVYLESEKVAEETARNKG